MKTLTKNLLLWSTGALLWVSPTQLPGSTLLIDRGLPTANLNLAASNRSNTSWVDPRNKAYDTNYNLIGDTITNTSSTDYHIDTIRLWAAIEVTLGPIDTANLWGGIHGGTINLLNASPSVTRVYYINGQNLGVLGRFALYQLDFPVAITLKAGQTFDFFLDGALPIPPYAPYVHASNAALSGSPQEGADNLMLTADFKHGVVKKVKTWDAIKQSWDKSTDVNVQVFGEVVEAGSTVATEIGQPTVDEFALFASVQLGLASAWVLPLLTL